MKIHLVLDKNPNKNTNNFFDKLKEDLEQNTYNSMLCTEPFRKTAFLNQLISKINLPVIYLDFDLLYSGYNTAGLIFMPKETVLYQLTSDNWHEKFKQILVRLSHEKSFIVIDSLNGFFNLFEERANAGRLVNTYLMLLVSFAAMSGSLICAAGIIKQNDKSVQLTPIGRRVIEIKKMTKINLGEENSNFLVNVYVNKTDRIYKIPIESELLT